MARTLLLLGVLLAAVPATSYAEWTLKPFAGVTFASSHGFVELDEVSGVQPTFGGAFGWDWAKLGVEAELATAPTFFKGASGLVESGRLDTFFVNANWRLLPSDARLQPYVTFGVGAARVTIDDALDAFTSTSALVAANLGAGVIATTGTRVRLIGEVRYIRSQFGDSGPAGLGEEFVTYWRATGGVLIRF
jgi:hypothetical protein